jgi:hypothetical protein
MVRNYADMLWSSYNFWCDSKFDKDYQHCGFEKWVIPGVHHRSPENFHDLMMLDYNRTHGVAQPFFFPIKVKPWDNFYPPHLPIVHANNYFQKLLDDTLFANGCRNSTLVIASEELDSNPLDVAQRVAKRLKFDITGIDISDFTHIRINTQDFKGESHNISISKYQQGLYNASGYLPMMNETRSLINEFWKPDCLFISKIANFRYPACFAQ